MLTRAAVVAAARRRRRTCYVLLCEGFYLGGYGRVCLAVHTLRGSKTGELKPYPLGELIHSEGDGEVIPSDFPHIRAGGPLGKHRVGNVASKHLHTIVGVVNGYVWLKPAEASTMAATVETAVR